MGTVRDFDFQSQLAFASDAGLARGVPDVDALRAPGMSTNQAAQFSSSQRQLSPRQQGARREP